MNVDAIHRLLPQTQCQRCGYVDCRAYAEAIVQGQADINQCPPGGAEGVRRLAQRLVREPKALDASHGVEGPLRTAWIVAERCIGCTLCLGVCPTDAIAGANKQLHVVLEHACTGCELCLPACPVDCIELREATPNRHGWDAWSQAQADAALVAYTQRQQRRTRELGDWRERMLEKAEHKLQTLSAEQEAGNSEAADKLARVRAAMQRAAQRLHPSQKAVAASLAAPLVSTAPSAPSTSTRP